MFRQSQDTQESAGRKQAPCASLLTSRRRYALVPGEFLGIRRYFDNNLADDLTGFLRFMRCHDGVERQL